MELEELFDEIRKKCDGYIEIIESQKKLVASLTYEKKELQAENGRLEAELKKATKKWEHLQKLFGGVK